MSSDPLTAIPADIGRIAGPLLIGCLLNWGLFGVLTMQVYVYYLACPDDPLRNKIVIYSVYLLEVVQTTVISQAAFHNFAAGFGDMGKLNEFGLLWFGVPILSGIVAFIAQSVYAYRVSVLSKANFIPIVIMLLACLQLAGAIATGIDTKEAFYVSNFLDRKAFITMGIWNGGSALCDVIIAICMTYYLTRLDSGIKKTQTLLRKLIRLIIETGTLTAALAIFNLIVAVLPDHPTYYMSSSGALGKMYSNSMLVVFNSRIRFAQERSADSKPDCSAISFELSARMQTTGTTRATSVYESK
ncbi:hypothetical protein B0H34DRAFT_712896 [Crassisporium funariophilum]|nr:hypothetical protein B0H34DRAFT_712896 [Crassisporium funariophilum]